MSDRGIPRVQAIFLARAAVCLAALSSACSSDPQAPDAHPFPGCEMHDITPCDAKTVECQKARFQFAACLRGAVGGAPPPLTLMTEDEYVDYVNRTTEGRDLPTNHYEIAMTWLGLAQPGSFNFVPLTKEGVAEWFGTYRWRQRDLLVIDHGKPADDVASNVALVAALIRALRDRDIQIGTWTTVVSVTDVDSNWGADAMWFGEARFFANRYQAALAGKPPVSSDELAQIDAGIREDVAWIRAQPSTYLATNARFAQNFGARATYLAWKRGGVEAVNTLYADKLITQQLMASETEELPPPTLKYHGRPRAPDEWDQDPTVTALGAWGLYLSLVRNLESDAAWSLALGWSGEQLFVYKGVAPNESETALVWQLEAVDETSASSVEAALTTGIPNAQVRRTGSFVTLAIASNQNSLDWAFVAD
jgi:hypothetical protein